jgi:diketogulonate reductase-like aldo/keto reductase
VHFDENYAAKDIKLSAEDLADIDRIFRPEVVAGERYPGNHNTFHEN